MLLLYFVSILIFTVSLTQCVVPGRRTKQLDFLSLYTNNETSLQIIAHAEFRSFFFSLLFAVHLFCSVI